MIFYTGIGSTGSLYTDNDFVKLMKHYKNIIFDDGDVPELLNRENRWTQYEFDELLGLTGAMKIN